MTSSNPLILINILARPDRFERPTPWYSKPGSDTKFECSSASHTHLKYPHCFEDLFGKWEQLALSARKGKSHANLKSLIKQIGDRQRGNKEAMSNRSAHGSLNAVRREVDAARSAPYRYGNNGVTWGIAGGRGALP
jgi:hypothetical protein